MNSSIRFTENRLVESANVFFNLPSSLTEVSQKGPSLVGEGIMHS